MFRSLLLNYHCIRAAIRILIIRALITIYNTVNSLKFALNLKHSTIDRGLNSIHNTLNEGLNSVNVHFQVLVEHSVRFMVVLIGLSL